MSNAIFSLAGLTCDRADKLSEATVRELSTTCLTDLEKILQNDLLPVAHTAERLSSEAVAPELKSDVVERRPVFPDLKAKVESFTERTLEPLKVCCNCMSFGIHCKVTSVSSNFVTNEGILFTFSHPMVFLPLTHFLLHDEEHEAANKKIPLTSGRLLDAGVFFPIFFSLAH
jgi:hypothetical protein